MPDTHIQSEGIEKMLKKLKAHPWLPPELLRLAGDVTRLQQRAGQKLRADGQIPAIDPATLAAPEAHRQGQALLPTAEFPYNAEAAARLWDELLELTAAMDGPMGQAAQAVRASMASADGLRPHDAFAAFVRNDADYFASWEKRLPEAPAMARFLAQSSLSPWLEAATIQLAPHHDAAVIWEHGHCPHCGQLPFIGHLRDKEGRRWHTCSFCRLTYRVPRLQCPICMEGDAAKLHFFTTQSEPGYEVHVCETCKNYIKLYDAKGQGAPTALAALAALEDLDSLPLDLVARQQGYLRSTVSAWGF